MSRVKVKSTIPVKTDIHWKKRLGRLAVAGGIVVLLGLVFFFAVGRRVAGVAQDYYVTLQSAPQVDAVLVPGMLVYPNGQPSAQLKQRLDHGLALYQAGKAPKIIVSGDHGRTDYDEVNSMRSYLLQNGVDSQDVFMDHAGFDTYDSMYRARDIFKVEQVIIATQRYHMDRSLYIARKLGLEAWGYAVEDQDLPYRSYLLRRESLAHVKAFLETEVLQRRPKYLGEAIPIWGSGLLTEG